MTTTSKNPKVKTCPTPQKRAHETRADACKHRDALRYQKDANQDLVAYPCVCGYWHVGHDSKRFRRRIRRALNSGRR